MNFTRQLFEIVFSEVTFIKKSKFDLKKKKNGTLFNTATRHRDEDGNRNGPSASIARSKTIHYDYTFRHRLYPFEV